MGAPNEKEVEGTLPTYVPIPSDHDGTLSELPRSQRRRRRLRAVAKHAVIFVITALVLCHFMKEGAHKGYNLVQSRWNRPPCGASLKDHHRGQFLAGVGVGEHPDIHPTECKKWSVYSDEEHSTFKYSFPTSSPSLNFITRGPFSGTVDYVLADEASSSDSIEVEITLSRTHEYIGSRHHEALEISIWRPSSWLPAVRSLKSKFAKRTIPKARTCLLVDNETDETVGFAILNHPERPIHKGEVEGVLKVQSDAPHHQPHHSLSDTEKSDFEIKEHHNGKHLNVKVDEREPNHKRSKASGFDESVDAHLHYGKNDDEKEHRHPHFHHVDTNGEYLGHHHEHEHAHANGHDRLNALTDEEKAWFELHRPPMHLDGEDHPHHPHPHPPHPHPHPRPPHKGPHHRRRIPVVGAKIVVTIPRGVTALPKLVSVFGGLETTVGSTFEGITFGDLLLIGKHVAVETITAEKASIISRGGSPIKGTYTVTDKLSIIAHNATISIDANLVSSPSAKKPTFVELINKFGDISSQIALLTSDESDSEDKSEVEHNGHFGIHTVSSGSNVLTNVTSQPLGSIVKVSAISSTSEVTASLPSTFEGRFTIIGKADVLIPEDTEDPSGEGRKRVVNVKNVLGKITNGSVKWVDADEVEEERAAVIGGWELIDWEEEMDARMITRKLHHAKVFQTEHGTSSVSIVTPKGHGTLIVA